MSLMLLMGAGLMIRSLANLRNVNPGLDARNVLTMTISVAQKKFASPVQENAFFERVLDRVRELPGIDPRTRLEPSGYRGIPARSPH